MNPTIRKIEAVREQIAKLEAAQKEPAHTHASRAEVKAVLVAQIDNWHAHAAERIISDLQRIAAGESAVDLLGTEATDVPSDFAWSLHAQVIDARAYLTFALGKGEMLRRFQPLLDQLPEGLTPGGRTRHFADTQRQIVQAELLEEKLWREADALGLTVDPRSNQRAEAAILVGYGQ